MIRDTIFRNQDIYANFQHDPSKIDTQGWGSDHPILPWTIEQLKPRLIIEVGSWKGRSAINMANKLKELKLDSEILCIDTWLGSPEHWLAKDGDIGWWDSLNMRNGCPQLYETFLNNVVANQCEQYITPFPTTSEAAFYVLKRLSITAPMIYIDAGHEFESVTRDLEMYWELLEEGGAMILDDYITWAGVTKAVDAFAFKNNLVVHGEREKAVITKNSKLNYSTKIIF